VLYYTFRKSYRTNERRAGSSERDYSTFENRGIHLYDCSQVRSLGQCFCPEIVIRDGDAPARCHSSRTRFRGSTYNRRLCVTSVNCYYLDIKRWYYKTNPRGSARSEIPVLARNLTRALRGYYFLIGGRVRANYVRTVKWHSRRNIVTFLNLHFSRTRSTLIYMFGRRA